MSNKPCRKDNSILDTLEHAYDDNPVVFYLLVIAIGLGFLFLAAMIYFTCKQMDPIDETDRNRRELINKKKVE